MASPWRKQKCRAAAVAAWLSSAMGATHRPLRVPAPTWPQPNQQQKPSRPSSPCRYCRSQAAPRKATQRDPVLDGGHDSGWVRPSLSWFPKPGAKAGLITLANGSQEIIAAFMEATSLGTVKLGSNRHLVSVTSLHRCRTRPCQCCGSQGHSARPRAANSCRRGEGGKELRTH